MSNFPAIETIKNIQQKLSKKKNIDSIIQNFKYNQKSSIDQNLDNLVSLIQTNLHLQNIDLKAFRKFIGNDDNIPIEINFSSLKHQNIPQLFSQWFNLQVISPISATSNQQAPPKLRNTILKDILPKCSQNIKDYYQSISKDSTLKGEDFYKMMMQTFQNVYIYQNQHGDQTFFEKVNSLGQFIEIVNQFVKYQHPTQKGIKINQIEDFIIFWEQLNSQLEITDERRKKIKHQEVQTQSDIPIMPTIFNNPSMPNLLNMHDIPNKHNKITLSNTQSQTQTQKDLPMGLEYFLNNSIKELNLLTEFEQNAANLTSIEKIFQILRKEKISYLQRKESEKKAIKGGQNHILRTLKTHQSQYEQAQKEDIDFEISDYAPTQMKCTKQLIEPNIALKNYKSKKSLQNKRYKCLQKIFNKYAVINTLTLYNLNKLLYDLGVLEKEDVYRTDSIVLASMKKSYRQFRIKQFIQIMDYIMQIDKQLNQNVIQQFSKLCQNKIKLQSNQQIQPINQPLNDNLKFKQYTFVNKK